MTELKPCPFCAGMDLKINNSDFGQLSNLLQNAMDFGKAQVGYDNLPPLPRF